jgi:hypothetical protein
MQPSCFDRGGGGSGIHCLPVHPLMCLVLTELTAATRPGCRAASPGKLFPGGAQRQSSRPQLIVTTNAANVYCHVPPVGKDNAKTFPEVIANGFNVWQCQEAVEVRKQLGWGVAASLNKADSSCRICMPSLQGHGSSAVCAVCRCNHTPPTPIHQLLAISSDDCRLPYGQQAAANCTL